MTQAPPRKPAAPGANAAESLERRLQTILERAMARATKEGEAELDSAQRVERHSETGYFLRKAEEEIRELGHHQEELTDFGRQRLREARSLREELRGEVAARQEYFNRRARAIFDVVEKARRAGRRALREHVARDRLTALAESVLLLDEFLTAAERRTLERLRADAEQTAEPEPVEESVAPSPAILVPAPAAWQFEEPEARLLAATPAAVPADPDGYRLTRWAEELSLVQGFDVLTAPDMAYGLAHFPHQIETARTVLRRMRGRALLCDEVGLGKTIEAGIIAAEYVARGLVNRILVLAPPVLVPQWQAELQEKFGLPFMTYDSPEFRSLGPEAWGRFDRIIASLHTARLPAHRAELLKQPFDLLIVDEAHHLRNRTSQGWKLVNELKKRYVLLLTATPVQNNLDELFNLITLLSPGQLKTSAAFRREFVARGDPRLPRNRERLRQLLAEVMVRNTRSHAHVLLPPRLAGTHRVAPSREEAAFYGALSAKAREWHAAGVMDRLTTGILFRLAGSSAPAAARSLEGLAERHRTQRDELRDLADAARGVREHAKLRELLNLLSRRKEAREKTVVFTGFRETLHMLEEALRSAGLSFATLSGEGDAAAKERAVAEFAGDRLVLLSTDVGSEGRNLQFCRAVINYDLPWNPMRIEQRAGRVHRIGQRKEVLIDNFCARQTIEDHILRILDAKLNMFELVVGEIGAILGNLETDQEFEELAVDIWTSAPTDTEAAAGFDELGRQLVEARERHREAQQLDEALFGDELVTPVEAPEP